MGGRAEDLACADPGARPHVLFLAVQADVECVRESDLLWYALRARLLAHRHLTHCRLGCVEGAGDRAGGYLDRLQWQCGRLCWPGEGEGQLVQQILSTLDSGIKVSLPFLLCFH